MQKKSPIETLYALKNRLAPAWYSKITFISTAIYLTLSQTSIPLTHLLKPLTYALITAIGCLMTAYLIHDALDKKEDKRKNTPKIIQKIPILKYLLLLLLSLSISILPWRYLPYNIHSLQLLGAEILLIIAYGMPPLRLKNYPYIAVLCDALYAYAIPCLLASYTFMLLTQNTQKLFLILLSLWTAMIGIRHYLNHLCMEYQVDAKSPKTTLAQLWGTQTIQQTITQRILPSEYLLFLATILSLTIPLTHKTAPPPILYLYPYPWNTYHAAEKSARPYTLQLPIYPNRPSVCKTMACMDTNLWRNERPPFSRPNPNSPIDIWANSL